MNERGQPLLPHREFSGLHVDESRLDLVERELDPGQLDGEVVGAARVDEVDGVVLLLGQLLQRVVVQNGEQGLGRREWGPAGTRAVHQGGSDEIR